MVGIPRIPHPPVSSNLAIIVRPPPILPYVSDGATPPGPSGVEHSRATDRATRHVLVIEDDEAIRTVYAELLGDEGYRTTMWAAAPHDPAVVSALAPDLIILDLVLGSERDAGRICLAQLQARPDTAAIPVLICTAHVPLTTTELMQMPVTGCGLVAKPFDLDEFLGSVRECLRPHVGSNAVPRPHGEATGVPLMPRPVMGGGTGLGIGAR
ncbi:MAG: hypothetical protein QOF33_5022 [Thermomicrobiales bacterium]|nr:hypothetical protein [Thermomicrobiales bacterium]